MKKLYTLLLIAASTYSFGQTFYSENMGVPTGTTAIATYATQVAPATFQNGTPIAYSGTGDMRATSVSSGYTGASGGGNVFMNADTEYFQIDGLNTSPYNTADIQLTFGALAATQMIVEQSTNGTDWTALTFTPDAAAPWTLYTVAGGQIPSSTTLSLRFRVTGTLQTRLDDVALSNVSASCTFAFGADTAVCDVVTFDLDTYTATLPFTGGGNATYTVVASAGTVGGDSPTTNATGNIIVTGLIEGSSVTVTVTGGTCNVNRVVAAPACKPINTLPFTENFEYAAGVSLTAQQKWVPVNSGDDITISAGSLNYTGVASFGNAASYSGAGIDASTSFVAVTTGTVYASFLLNVTDYTNVTTDGTETYIATLTEPNNGAFRARVFMKKSGTQYQLGLASAGTTTTNYASTLFNVGDVVFVVIGYDFASNTLNGWLNPTVAGFTAATPATLTETPASPILTLGGFLLRQDNATTTPTLTVDALRIATTIGELLSVAQNDIAGLRVYPNPVTNGTLYIATDSNETKSVAIYDVLGKMVVNAATDSAVNVSGLTAGVYIVKITEAGKTATRKLVIK